MICYCLSFLQDQSTVSNTPAVTTETPVATTETPVATSPAATTTQVRKNYNIILFPINIYDLTLSFIFAGPIQYSC